jgi:PAS domain S-box-containing protein
MEQQYRILILEDLPTDARLAEYEIRKVLQNFSTHVVETENAFLFELENFKPHIVVSDYMLPSFNGLKALHLVQKFSPDVPVIILTGSMNEDTAVDCMKAGATDYVIKEHIKRLGQSILNAIEQQKIKHEKLEAQQLLKQSEAKYRYMFSNSPQPMWIFDVETLAFLEVNTAAVRHYGYSVEEFLSMTIGNIHPVEEMTGLLKDIQLAGKNDNYRGEWKHRKKNGEIIFVEITSFSVDYNGREARHVVVNDITERHLAERQIKLLNRAIEQSPVSVVITNSAGEIQYVNPKFTELTGYGFEEVFGKNPNILKSGEYNQEFYQKLWETILSGQLWRGEIHNKKKSGELYWESEVIAPIINENRDIVNFVAIKEDISEKKKMIAELIDAKEHAEESDRLKTAFLHNISHEIRTPLNAIIGFSDLLNEAQTTLADREYFSHIISQNGFKLAEIINDIVNIATFEAGQEKLNLGSADVNQLMDDIYKRFKTKVQSKNLMFNQISTINDSEACIITDETKLMQILSNFLGNAVKFTEKGKIEIGCTRQDNVLQFYVSDTGVGIPKQYHQFIFEKFKQVEHENSKFYSGNGLGLTIAKAYAEMMGGNIRVESEPGKGSAFFLSIPFHPAPQAEDQKNDDFISENDTTNQKNILIVDDEIHNSRYLEVILKKLKYNIITASNGSEAIEMCKDHPEINLVLMDIKMPVTDGYEATKQIKIFRPALPIIAQTAYALVGDENKALAAGCDAYIAKPIKKDLLLEKIHSVLS